MIPLDISAVNDNSKKELINNEKNESTESNPYTRLNLEYVESAIFPPNDNEFYIDQENKEFSTDDDDDRNKVF
jgi:hypothetical protein